ncbi:fibroblast growth factor receptor 2-like [Ptychodera flava]|uniref:fibroblast growth factor receptor 2-like n=1 Tax=Ptychodera flava TaxID=63121 RepID=UPI00396A332E
MDVVRLVGLIVFLLSTTHRSMSAAVLQDGGRRPENFDPFCFHEPTNNVTDFVSIEYTRPIGSPPLRFSYQPQDGCSMTLYVPAPDNELPPETLQESTMTCSDVTERDYRAPTTVNVYVPVENWPKLSIIDPQWGLLTTLLAEVEFRSPEGLTRLECLYHIPSSPDPLTGRLTYNIQIRACPPGLYGADCSENCTCYNGASCHSFNGACYCAPGWRGQTCEQVYPEAVIIPSQDLEEVYVSEQLNLTCGVFHFNATSTSWYFNSVFLHGNEVHSVDFVSDVNYRDKTRTTGNYTCVVESTEGDEYEAIFELQVNDCPPGMYGTICDINCACPVNSTCERFAGCLCFAGLTGNNCDHVCPSNYYGRNCSEECLCQNGDCDHVTGNCTCIDGWEGVYCEEKMPGLPVQYLVVAVVLGVLFGALVIFVIAYALRRRSLHRKKIYTSASDRIKVLQDIAKVDSANDGEGSVMVADISKWIIKGSELKMGQPVGEGGFGAVFKAKYRKEGAVDMTVAVKTCKADISMREEKALLSEAYHHIRLGIHENIVNIHGVVVNDGPLKLVVEYAEKGDLIEYLLELQSKQKYKKSTFLDSLPLEGSFLTDITVDACRGLAYLHQKHIIHRDIAARNVVIYGDNVGKLCDFGLARDVYSYIYKKPINENDDVKLPLRWMAPETLEGDFGYSEKSDIWSFGVLLWEVSSLGRRPYEDLQNDQILSMIKIGKRLSRCPGCPRDLYKVMKDCWNSETDSRPSASDLVQRLITLKHQRKGFFSDPMNANLNSNSVHNKSHRMPAHLPPLRLDVEE